MFAAKVDMTTIKVDITTLRLHPRFPERDSDILNGMECKISKYRNLFETLRREILAGKYDGDGRFPSEQQLIRRFGVSRITVRHATNELKAAGLIEMLHGSGTYLTPKARQTVGTLGLIVPNFSTSEIFSPICNEISRLCREHGYTLMFSDIPQARSDSFIRETLNLVRSYAERRVAGVFLLPLDLVPGAPPANREILDILSARGIPVVLLDRGLSDEGEPCRCDLVGIRNVSAGRTLTLHLIEAGATKIAFFHLPHGGSAVHDRKCGIINAVLDSGLKIGNFQEVIGDPDNPILVKRTFSPGKFKNGAIICANDLVAARLLATLTKVGIRTPDDVLVAGFDGVRINSILTPTLTTMKQPVHEIAACAFQTLLERIRVPSAPAKETLLDAELVCRESTSPVRRVPKKRAR